MIMINSVINYTLIYKCIIFWGRMKDEGFKVDVPRCCNDVTSSLAAYFTNLKKNRFSDKVMTVGIFGLSQSGKTSLSNSLVDKVDGALAIDGDMYQVGREFGMPIYEEVLENLRENGEFDMDFHHKVWRYDLIEKQIFDAVDRFNRSGDSSATLYLEDVIDVPRGKHSDSMHNEQYDITKGTTILLPLMFQGYLSKRFDKMVMLNIRPEASVERKLKKVPDRDPELTEKMVLKVEYPVMVHQVKKYNVDGVIHLDTNDFDRVFTL